MRRLISFLLLLFVTAVAVAQGLPESKQIVFSESKFDFGNIKETGGVVTHVFNFKNVSNRPVIINFVSVSCGCTTPQYSKEPVMPGKSSSVKISYDPADRPGFFNKEIFVISDSRKAQNKLTITGSVEGRPRTIEDDYPAILGEGVRASSVGIWYGNLPINYNHTQVIDVYNESSKPVTIKAVPRRDNPLVELLCIPEKLEPKGKGEIIFSYKLKGVSEFGALVDDFDIIVNGKKLAEPIKVRATAVPDFTKMSTEERRDAPIVDMPSVFYHFSEVKDSEQLVREFTVINKGKTPLRILKMLPSSSRITARAPSVIAPEATGVIAVTLNAKGAAGRLSESVIVIFNAPASPTKEIRVAAVVEK